MKENARARLVAAVADAMHAKGMTQKQLALAAGTSQGALCGALSGKGTMSPTKWQMACEALGLDYEEIVADLPEEKNSPLSGMKAVDLRPAGKGTGRGSRSKVAKPKNEAVSESQGPFAKDEQWTRILPVDENNGGTSTACGEKPAPEQAIPAGGTAAADSPPEACGAELKADLDRCRAELKSVRGALEDRQREVEKVCAKLAQREAELKKASSAAEEAAKLLSKEKMLAEGYKGALAAVTDERDGLKGQLEAALQGAAAEAVARKEAVEELEAARGVILALENGMEDFRQEQKEAARLYAEQCQAACRRQTMLLKSMLFDKEHPELTEEGC